MNDDINPNLRAIIYQLFDQLSLTYANKFTNQYKHMDLERVQEHWCRAMKGYTPRELKLGISKLGKTDWPPTLVEFLKLCRHPVDSMKAYYEAIEGFAKRSMGEEYTYSHPAIFYAASNLYFDLTHKTYSEIKERWASALDTELEKGQWPTIQAPALQIGCEKTTGMSDKSKKIIEDNVKAILKRPVKDQKDWARRIRDESRKPVHYLMQIQIEFAREALGLEWGGE